MMRKRILCMLSLLTVLCTVSAQQHISASQNNNSNGREPEVFTVAYATSDDGFLNVRSLPSNNGVILEKLWMQFHGLGNGVLLEWGEKWSKVSVGTVKGWVYNKYLGTQTWYDGTGKTVLIAARNNMPIYGENYKDEGDYPLFTTVKKGTVIADNYDEIEGYYVLKTGHDYLFIKKNDVEIKHQTR